MIRWAIDRASPLAPADRTLIVVAEQHRTLWERELADLGQGSILPQPRNRGTGIGILLPLVSRIPTRDHDAIVVVLPSDHFVANEGTLQRAIKRAVTAVRRDPSRCVLLGVVPGSADNEYGWILPAASAGAEPQDVLSFVEKPASPKALILKRQGGLLNTFIFVATASTLVELFKAAVPGLVDLLLDPLVEIERAYEEMPVVDFSRDVLARSTGDLSVISVPECGWNDLGTPDRIRAFRREFETPCRTTRPAACQLNAY
jgi:mannose-1-phosphate guanylyltransferase